MIALGSFGIIAYPVRQRPVLRLSAIPSTFWVSGELAVFCGALIGGRSRLFMVQCAPAAISWAIRIIGHGVVMIVAIAVSTNTKLFWHHWRLVRSGSDVVIIPGCFLKLTGKRVFRMAQSTINFEQMGWTERKL